jgi:pentose-5-phosphate-3-epimerase
VELRKNGEINFEIGVDGGINEEIIKDIKKIGASIAYCGGAIFNDNVISSWEKLNYASNN